MDRKQFEREVVPLGRKLYRFALQYVKNNEEAEDAVQEVMLKLWQRKDLLGNYNSVEAFAVTVTRNHCLDRLRMKRTVSIGNMPWPEQPASGTRAPDVLLDTRQAVNDLKTLMEQLPEKQRAIVQLRDVEEFEYHEIAEMLNTDLNLIRVNLSRARKKLREMMQKIQDHGMERDKGAS